YLHVFIAILFTYVPHAFPYCFSFHAARYPRHLHSFPTRRSSDLADAEEGEAHKPWCDELDERDSEVTDSSLQTQSGALQALWKEDRKSTRLNSSHVSISYAVFCLKKKKKKKK